jgi:hypothetical protein
MESVLTYVNDPESKRQLIAAPPIEDHEIFGATKRIPDRYGLLGALDRASVDMGHDVTRSKVQGRVFEVTRKEADDAETDERPLVESWLGLHVLQETAEAPFEHWYEVLANDDARPAPRREAVDAALGLTLTI